MTKQDKIACGLNNMSEFLLVFHEVETMNNIQIRELIKLFVELKLDVQDLMGSSVSVSGEISG